MFFTIKYAFFWKKIEKNRWRLISMIFQVFRTILTSPANFSQHFNSDWCRKHVRRRSGGQFMTRTSCLRKPHCLSGRHIVSQEDTLSLTKTNCLSRDCLSGKHIVSPEDTLSPRKTHCLSRRHIVSPEDIYVLFREDYVLFREDYIIVCEDYVTIRENYVIAAKTILLSAETIFLSAKTI